MAANKELPREPTVPPRSGFVGTFLLAGCLTMASTAPIGSIASDAVGWSPFDLSPCGSIEPVYNAISITEMAAEKNAATLLSLIRHGAVQPDAIWELKTQALKKSGLLNLCRSEQRLML